MKWINIPEGAESGGLHVCECVCRQTALGDQECTTACGFKRRLSFCLSQLFFPLHAQSGQQHFGVEANHAVYQPSFSPLALVANFMKPYFSGDAADRQGARLLSFKCRFTSCLRQELMRLVGRKLPCAYICRVIQSAAFCVMKLKNRSPVVAQVHCFEKRVLVTLMHTDTHTHTLLPRNYTNLMPHSPLLILNSVHIFILALNEGAATCITPKQKGG